MKKTWIIILSSLLAAGIIIALILWNPFAKGEGNAAVKEAEVNYQKGLELYESGDFAAAEAAFGKAVSLNKKESVYLGMLVESQLEQGKIEEAEKSFAQLVKNYPDRAQTLFLEGKLLFLKEKFSEAVEKLSLAIEKDQSLSKAWLYRGRANSRLELPEEAVKDFLKAAESDSSILKTALEGAAEAYEVMKNFPEAIAIYSSFIERDSADTKAYLQRAKAKNNNGEPRLAIEDYSEVIRLEPTSGEAFLNRGICYAQIGKLQNTVADSKSAAENGYKPASAWYNAAKASFFMGLTTEATTYLNKIPGELADTSIQVDKNLLFGTIRLRNGEFDQAIASFTKVIALDGKQKDAYFNRGIAYEGLKNYEAALKDLEKSKRLGYNSPDIYYAIGIQQYNLGNSDEACKNLRKALDMGYKPAEIYVWRHCSN
ncbi:MAG: tetratricopeptide repeat protein [Bacteroidales bacterium]|nr:tetratricopeptide repeat protein [Bacteroidales bacterium]